MKPLPFLYCTLLLLSGYTCAGNHTDTPENVHDSIPVIAAKPDSDPTIDSTPINDSIRTIHIFVALCDNKYQGIVPVPASIGNGQDPKNNLYWGAGYGIKSYFTNKSTEWKLLSTTKNPAQNILERLLFKHKTQNVYLLADAYDGQYIQKTTIDFLNAAAGKYPVILERDNKKLAFGGRSKLLAYVGHDGLMDFSLNQTFIGDTFRKRETIILACYSKSYFKSYVKSSGAEPLLWTSGLMAPEAYTLHDAIEEWINNKSPQAIKIAAARAYAKYQKCSIKAAQNLILQGW